MDKFDVVIIGAGPAGLTAGYELSKSNKKVLVLEKKSSRRSSRNKSLW